MIVIGRCLVAIVFLVSIAPGAGCAQRPDDAEGRLAGAPVSFETSDGVTIYGDVFKTGEEKPRTLILLFHQGGSNGRGEYRNIVPRLVAGGYSVISVDQRRGGERYGGENRTASALNTDYSYCACYPDLHATLAYARDSVAHEHIVLWGSSYSAALALQLAARNPGDVSGVLAFSPASGDAMDGCRPEQYAQTIEAPVLVLRPAGEAAIESVAAQLETFRDQGHNAFVADIGVHGSSMLDASRSEGDVEATWAVVMSFLETVGD